MDEKGFMIGKLHRE
jgi:hypothetical protein